MSPKMSLKLIETTILIDAIHMRLADHADRALAKEWIDFQVPLKPLALPSGVGQEAPLGDTESRRLGTVRLAALRYVREIIAAETQHLADRLKRQT